MEWKLPRHFLCKPRPSLVNILCIGKPTRHPDLGKERHTLDSRRHKLLYSAKYRRIEHFSKRVAGNIQCGNIENGDIEKAETPKPLRRV